MSDTGDSAYEGVEGEAVDSGQAGEIESRAEGSEQVEAPARQYLEVEDPSSVWTKIKVNGEEIEVPLAEALSGYSRTADYTQKTQEAARLREEAQEGMFALNLLKTDPVRGMRLLQELYAPPEAQPQPVAPEVPSFDDPLEEKLWHQEQRFNQLQNQLAQRELEAQVNHTVQGLKQEYGASDEDIFQTVAVARQMNVGVEALPQIYKAMAYDRLVANFRASQQVQQETAAQTQQRQAAASQASRLVGTGSSSTGVTTAPPNTGYRSIREAAEAAIDELGLPQ